MEINNEFFQKHAPLVRIIAKQYDIPTISHDDLFQEGCIGLIEAGRHYLPERGIRFESYAAWWIRKYITEAIRRYGQIICIPQHTNAEHIFTELLDRVVASDDGEPLTYEDILASTELQPDERLIFQEGINAWENEKKRQKKQKKRTNVGKFMQKYVNK